MPKAKSSHSLLWLPEPPFFAVRAAGGDDELYGPRNEPVHHGAPDDRIGEDREPILRRTVGGDDDGAFGKALIADGIQELGFRLAVGAEGKVIEDEQARADAAFQEQLRAARRESVGREFFQELVRLEEDDIDSTASHFMAEGLGDMRFSDAWRAC